MVRPHERTSSSDELSGGVRALDYRGRQLLPRVRRVPSTASSSPGTCSPHTTSAPLWTPRGVRRLAPSSLLQSLRACGSAASPPSLPPLPPLSYPSPRARSLASAGRIQECESAIANVRRNACTPLRVRVKFLTLASRARDGSSTPPCPRAYKLRRGAQVAFNELIGC